MPSSTRIYIALGSNIGDGAALLSAALNPITDLAIGDVTRSSLWLSAPLGLAADTEGASAWFTNAVVGLETDMDEFALMHALQEIEKAFGRPPNHCRNMPRTLDLDIISYGSRLVDSATLTVPHPRACERLFVLLPLAEVAPHFRWPGTDVAIQNLIADAPAMDIRKSAAF